MTVAVTVSHLLLHVRLAIVTEVWETEKPPGEAENIKERRRSGPPLRGGVTLSASWSGSSRCTTHPKALSRTPIWRTSWDDSWAQNMVFCRQGSRSLAVLRDQQEEMIRLRDLGANTPVGVTYIKEKILAMVRKGKQRWHIPGIGRVVARKGKIIIFVDQPRGTYTNAEIDEMLASRDKALKEATNILLQGLPKDIYTLINHYTDAKDIWDNVKMLLEGFELTKEDRESQLYDDFEHFCQNKGETIHDYYGRFVTIVKLNRGLKDSNYDQLYAYLKQHKAHANKNKMMLDRFTQHTIDPLALISNVSYQQYYSQSSTTPPSTYVQPYFTDSTQLDLGLSLIDNLIKNLTNILALLTQSYKTYLPQTSKARQIKCYNCNDIGYIVRNYTQPKRPQNSKYFKDKMLLMQAQENRVALDEEQILFIAGGQDNVVDEDVDGQPTMFIENLLFADPVYDEASPSYDSDILYEVPDHENYQDADCEYHEVHEMHDDVQPNYVVDSHTDYVNDSNMIPYD
nr:hypothetical protein [Tanacetum cinerariifolium]